HLEVTEPGAARLRASGRLDGAGAGKLRAVAESLARAGCRRLEIDISRLDDVTAGALIALLATVRALKALGAEVRLVEREGRFARATRGSHLTRSIPAMAGAASLSGDGRRARRFVRAQATPSRGLQPAAASAGATDRRGSAPAAETAQPAPAGSGPAARHRAPAFDGPGTHGEPSSASARAQPGGGRDTG